MSSTEETRPDAQLTAKSVEQQIAPSPEAGHLPHDNTQVPSADTTVHAAAFSGVPEPPHAAQSVAANLNPFESVVITTPSLPSRPEVHEETEHTDTSTMVSTTGIPPPEAPNANIGVEEDHVSPEVQALRAMFPDFDVAVLQSVLDTVNNDQIRALDILLGMSDPKYVSTQSNTAETAEVPTEQSSVDLDEQLARQLMLEDQQQQQRRHATGNSWPRRDDADVPYQTRQHHPQKTPVPPSEGRTDLQELQKTMGQIAESGKRTFSSIFSKVKAKISEYEQSRNVNPGQSSNASTTPQWGPVPPAHRHAASQAYQQQYFASGQGNTQTEPSQIALNDSSRAQGNHVDTHPAQSQPAPHILPTSSPVPTPAARSTSPPTGAGLSPAASPRPSSDVPRPPPTSSGSPINPVKIGLLPKRPVSLLNTNSPPATRPSDDDDGDELDYIAHRSTNPPPARRPSDLEYLENPFEEHK